MLSYYEKKTLKVLLNHKGKENPITGKYLAEEINLPERRSGKEGADMRAIIHRLRTNGWPICASDKGYYLAQTKEELAKFIVALEKRIKSQREAVKGLNRAFDRVGIIEIPEITEEGELKEMAQEGYFG